MKVVIDCNVLVSAGRTGGVCGAVILEAVRHHQIVLSGPIVDEYKEVAGRHAHAAYRDAIDRIIAGLERVAELSNRRMSLSACAIRMTRYTSRRRRPAMPR